MAQRHARENPRGVGAAFECGSLASNVLGQACVDRKSVAGETNRRLEALLERQTAELLREMRPCRYFARNSGRERGIGRSARHRLALGIEKHIAGGRSGRDLASIHEQVESVARTMQHVETAAAQSGAARFGDFQRCTHRYGGVECVAAGSQGSQIQLRSRAGRHWLLPRLGVCGASSASAHCDRSSSANRQEIQRWLDLFASLPFMPLLATGLARLLMSHACFIFFNSAATIGWTNSDTSPPKVAISRTKVDEMKVNCS